MRPAPYSSARRCGLNPGQLAGGWKPAVRFPKQVLLPTAQKRCDALAIDDRYAEPVLQFKQRSCEILVG